MSWDDPVVKLLVTDDCRAKALVRYELVKLECRFGRQSKVAGFKMNSTDEAGSGLLIDKPVRPGVFQANDTSLLVWLDKMFQVFVDYCPLSKLDGPDVVLEEQPRLTRHDKINQLFKLISEAQRVPMSYDKNG